jgi:PAS domain S-box-containing protein
MPISEIFLISHYQFNPLAVPPVLTAIAIAVLGVAVVIHERGSRVSLSFLSIVTAAAVWLLAISGGYFATDESTALWWDKAVYLAIPIIPATVYQFSVIVTGVSPRRRLVSWLTWATAIGLAIGITTTGILFDRLNHYSWGYYPAYRWFGVPYLLWFLSLLIAALVQFWHAYRRAVPGTTAQQRLKSFLIAFGIAYLGALDYLPAWGVPIYPFGFIFLVAFLILSARAIWRYRLVDITPALAADEIIDTMADSLIVLDGEGIVRLVNRAASELLGTAESQIVGRHATDTPCGAFMSTVVATLLAGGTIRRSETEFQPDHGALCYLSLSASLMRGRKERILAVVCVARDITDRVLHEKQIEDQATELRLAYDTLQRTQVQALQKERLYALGTMASGIAHDLNNALTPILGYSELLLAAIQAGNGSSQERDWVGLINQGAIDASQVLARLSEFYRPATASDRWVSVDLNALVESVVALTHPRWHAQALLDGRTIDVSMKLAPTPPIRGIPGELREVLTNLIFNAVDAMPDGGQIAIRTYQVLGIDSVGLEVVDSGAGMTDEVRLLCINPFFSTKGAQGSGLGLSVVHGSIRRHAGTLEIESAIGRGTTFRITLPCFRSEPIKVRDASPADHRLRILLVEDDSRVRDVLTLLLIRDDHNVTAASNGTEGLALLGSEEYDLVITDRGLPGVGGDEVAVAVKQRSPNTPVIMLTGFGGLMNATQEHPGGVDLVVSKPVTAEVLRSAVAQVTTKRAAQSSGRPIDVTI